MRVESREVRNQIMERLEILRQRHSVRSFTDEPLLPEVVKKLKAEITMTNTHQHGIKFQLITDDPDPFKGYNKSYGLFENPRNYLAAVVDTATPDILERAGYFAEQFAIKAVEMGLGSCFVGGTYHEKDVKVQMRAGERILFLVLVGYAKEKPRFIANLMANIIHRKKMTARDFFEPGNEYDSAIIEIDYLKEGLEGVACAPSSLNRRPVRVFLKDLNGEKTPCARVDVSNPNNLIDLGIAKFNFNYATGTECEWGNGAPLKINLYD